MSSVKRRRPKLDSGKSKSKKSIIPVDLYEDRLSALPENLIHHVLSFVPTPEIVRMSVVSKRWRHIWLSVPVLYLLYPRGPVRCSVVTLMDKCLNQRWNNMLKNTDSCVTTLKLDLHVSLTERLDFWLCAFLGNRLKELDLRIRSNGSEYCLPSGSFNLRSLTDVKLGGFEFGDKTFIDLPLVQTLALENVLMSDQVLHNLLIRCCSIKYLSLKHCRKLSNVRIFNSSLKDLEIVKHHQCRHEVQTSFRVDVMNLRSFVFTGDHCSWDRINLSCGDAIQHLSLSSVRFCNQSFADFVHKSPHLESLSLYNCTFQHLKISNRNLQRFVLEENKRSLGLEASIDAPNLVSFSFGGDLLTEFSMTAPNISGSSVQLSNPITLDAQWYFNLLDFLTYLDCSKSLSLGVYSEGDLIFPSKFRRICCSPLSTLKHLTVKTNCPLSRETELRGSILWLSPSLETLSIELNPDTIIDLD